MKCITLSVPNESSQRGSSQPNALPILSIPTTNLAASLKSDCLTRINTTEGKAAWKIRRDAMEEVRISVSKCGGLIGTEEGNEISFLKQLFSALRSRLTDSQSNLKPIAATLIGGLLNHIDGNSQAKLGKIVFPALINAAMNDMKKTMRDAAASALSMGTDHSTQNGGGTNILATESFIVCLESQLSDAALKSSGLQDVITFLAKRLESLESSNTLSGRKQLAKVIVLSLLSSKAGTRSASEKLLTICAKNEFVSSGDLDKEIGSLKPAQQRAVRTFIPKNSTQDQELIDTFKRPSSRVRQPVRSGPSNQQKRRMTKSNQVAASPAPSTIDASASNTHNDANPLHPIASKSTKLQRLSLLGRSDNWPEYPEEPNGDATLQILRKSWALLISPPSIQLLFPKGGIRSHEDSIRGCMVISQSIEYSRNNNDVSFIEQLDFILKWASCALSSRDHTSGLRSLLSMLQLLFERLHDLSYIMNDAEAIILLPCMLEKAAIAKSQFKDKFLTILSFIRSEELYQLQRYGSTICMKVIEKSKSIRARSLGATECSSCVKVIGAGAIGRKGVVTLALALSSEKLQEICVSYLDLFYYVVRSSTLEKVLAIIGDAVPDKTKDKIVERCSKRPLTAPSPTGSRAIHHGDPNKSKPPSIEINSETQISTVSPQADKKSSDQAPSSSAAVTGALRSRLQRFRTESQTADKSLPCTPSLGSALTIEGTQQATPPKPPSKMENLNLCSVLDDIMDMVKGILGMEGGSKAIRKLALVVKKNDAPQIESLRQQISPEIDRFVVALSNALTFAFEQKSALPCSLIQGTVDSLTYAFRTSEYSSAISKKSLEYCIGATVGALLDERLDSNKGAKTDNIISIGRMINKASIDFFVKVTMYFSSSHRSLSCFSHSACTSRSVVTTT